MKKQMKFLCLLWSFVILSYILFQNFTQEGSSVSLHNQLCQEAFDLNQSRIMNVNKVQADVLAAWPKTVGHFPQASIDAVTMDLLESNRQMYVSCRVEGQTARSSHVYALNELKKLSNPETNPAFQGHVAALEAALKVLKE